MDVATWNVLHDGRITAVAESVPGILRLTIEIEYLCDYLPTTSRHVVVTLIDCARFEYQPYEGTVVSDPLSIAAFGLEVLSAGAADERLAVECADGGAGGRLTLQYGSAHTETGEGRQLSQAEMEAASERYWSAWEEKNQLAWLSTHPEAR